MSTTSSTQINGSDESYVHPRELETLLNIKERTILDWARRYADFPFTQLPGSIRVRPSEVMAWLDKLTNETKQRNASKE